jgi:hypothetical protein
MGASVSRHHFHLSALTVIESVGVFWSQEPDAYVLFAHVEVGSSLGSSTSLVSNEALHGRPRLAP